MRGWGSPENGCGAPAFPGQLLRGFLWVEPEPRAGEGRRFEVFDEAGRFLGDVDVPASFETRNPRPVFGRQHLHGVSTDDLGVPYIVGLEIVGRP